MAKRLALAAVACFLTAAGFTAEPERISTDAVHPAISGDGRYVVFETAARLLPDDTDRLLDVYVMDRKRGKLELVEGPEKGRYNSSPSISQDGSLVAFHSVTPTEPTRKEIPAGDIVLVHRNNQRRYFLPTGPVVNDGQSLDPQLSPDGRHVLFTSNASQLAVHRDHAVRAIFLFDRNRWATVLVSRSTAGEPTNRPSAGPRMSADARYVAYLSAATNLMAGDPPDALSNRLYFVDRTTGRLLRIDEFERGFDPREWWVGRLTMDEKGATVVFEARQRSQAQSAELSKSDLFAFDRKSGKVSLLTTGIFGSAASAPALSADGRYLAFVFSGVPDKKGRVSTAAGHAGLVVYDRTTDIWREAALGVCENPVFSADGNWIAFEALEETRSREKKKSTKSVFVVKNPFKESN